VLFLFFLYLPNLYVGGKILLLWSIISINKAAMRRRYVRPSRQFCIQPPQKLMYQPTSSPSRHPSSTSGLSRSPPAPISAPVAIPVPDYCSCSYSSMCLEMFADSWCG
jgi:hypothetical protein